VRYCSRKGRRFFVVWVASLFIIEISKKVPREFRGTPINFKNLQYEP